MIPKPHSTAHSLRQRRLCNERDVGADAPERRPMSDLLLRIRRALPYGGNPQAIDDMVSDVAVLVLEGRINENDLAADIRLHLVQLRAPYYERDDVSLSKPIGDDGAVLADVLLKPAVLAKRACPTCRKRVKAGRTYCRPACALVASARRRRKVDPKELEYLHRRRWLSRKDIARALGVTIHGVNNVVQRHGLGRHLPDVCRVDGCGETPVRFRHCRGHLAGNLCLAHKRAAQRAYTAASRRRRNTPLTPEQRQEHARRASIARWVKAKAAPLTPQRDEAKP
jgi:hypothetical protein